MQDWPVMDEVSSDDLLGAVFEQLRVIKWLLAALLAVAVLLGTTVVFEQARGDSETKADALVECFRRTGDFARC